MRRSRVDLVALALLWAVLKYPALDHACSPEPHSHLNSCLTINTSLQTINAQREFRRKQAMTSDTEGAGLGHSPLLLLCAGRCTRS